MSSTTARRLASAIRTAVHIEMLPYVDSYAATVTAVSATGVQFRRASEATAGDEVYARLAFQHVRVGDEVAVIQVGKHPFVIGVIRRAALGTPTYTLNSIAGTGATMSIVGSDYSGTITVTAGSASLGAGQLFDFTFAAPFADANYSVVLQPASNAAGDHQARSNVTGRTTTKWTFNLRTALTASSTYIWLYQIRPNDM